MNARLRSEAPARQAKMKADGRESW